MGNRRFPLRIVRHARARGYRLRVERDGSALRLTLPVRASMRAALSWVGGQQAWIDAQLAKSQIVEVSPGSRIMFEGAPLLIDWQAAAPRTPVCRQDAADGAQRLTLGGPAEGVARRVESWLRKQARAALEPASHALAARIGAQVSAVRLGDPRSRWGSCSSNSTLSYSWRLIMAPPFVLDYVVAHEVAHLRHANHGAAFHALTEDLYGADPAPARAWLREQGSSLHQYRF